MVSFFVLFLTFVKCALIYLFLILRFLSNFLGRGLGFQFQYDMSNVAPQMTYRMAELGECGGTFSTLSSGKIASPSYPARYPGNSDCVYEILQPPGTVILLNVISMHTVYDEEWCDGCCDYLDIRDGPSDDSPLLGRLCGTEIPAPIQSTQSKVWMKWGQINKCSKMTQNVSSLIQISDSTPEKPEESGRDF